MKVDMDQKELSTKQILWMLFAVFMFGVATGLVIAKLLGFEGVKL